MSSQPLKLFDSQGNFIGVFLTADLWSKVDKLFAPAENRQPENPDEEKELKTFLQFWDFPYEYDYAVSCPACAVSSPNWLRDPERPFILKNANLGGLLVFHCKNCGATIRHKYFKDHKAVEYTPGG